MQHRAAQNRQASVLKFIFSTYTTSSNGEEIVDVLAKNKAGRSALTDAFQSQDTDVIELCLSHPSSSEERLLQTHDTASKGKSADFKLSVEEESGQSDPLQHAVTHHFQLSPAAVKSPVSVKMRELPITRADNPFGSEAAPQDDSTGPFVHIKKVRLVLIIHMSLTIGLCIWPAAIILARWVVELYSFQANQTDGQADADTAIHPLRGKTVLELGAGCGLPLLATGRPFYPPLHCRVQHLTSRATDSSSQPSSAAR